MGFRDRGAARKKKKKSICNYFLKRKMAAALLAVFNQNVGCTQTDRRRERKRIKVQSSWGFTLLREPDCLRLRRKAKSGQNLQPDSAYFNHWG